uniref:U-box domain containing 5 n=1 Tax=Laticauda laticaudata TaxID=8630 RepID=A0A8C5RWV9_LATLA
MVINLCLPQFKPRIHCNKISADGYEVENLISEDPIKRHRGFRCEYFIKPPVQVTISFPFNVEICRINIDTSSGSCHNITGLDIYTATSSNKVCWNSPEPLFSVPSGQPPASDKETFTLVGKAVLKNQSKVTFGHRGFRPRPPFHHQADPLLSFPGSASLDLWNKGPASLSSVTWLKICIAYVAGSGLPSIKRVEVWGQPSKSCSHDVVDDVLRVATKSSLDASDSQLPTLPLPMESDAEPDSREQKLVEVLQHIPEEFLDPITLEIMTLPMLLPSGKVIDRGTLEKCNRSEATWGRVPSDPFTGVAFSPHTQPLPHPSLKARIDYFLLQHDIPGVNLLGRSQASGTVVASSLAMSSLKRKIDLVDQNQEGVPEGSHCAALDFAVASSLGFHAKRVKMEWDLNSSQMDCSTEAATHEQRLSESLDSALNSALSMMPFTTSLAKSRQHGHSSSSSSSDVCGAGGAYEHERNPGPQGCSSCSRAFSPYFKTEAIYQLPCRHLVCRACLADQPKSPSVLCMNCKRLFATHDISRVHF